MKNESTVLYALLRRKNKALANASKALQQASARLDSDGRGKLGSRFKDESIKAELAMMEVPCVNGGEDGL